MDFTEIEAQTHGRFKNEAIQFILFLDEIANVSLNLQAKLLRVLQTGEMERVGSSKTRRVDVRILAATNADVNAELAAGRFRQDLLIARIQWRSEEHTSELQSRLHLVCRLLLEKKKKKKSTYKYTNHMKKTRR